MMGARGAIDCGCDCDNNYRRVRMFARAEEGAAIVSCRVGGTKRGERSEGAGVRKKSGVSGRLSELQACMQAHSGIDCCNADASPPAKFQNGPAALPC